ncbi:MAG: hypothetical protein HY868_00510 [Chloroflexi bacterium]|nr:hypothetical protein [Chloroflexota bacterium]
MVIKLTIHKPRPYFAEVPYYLWGEVNYKSDGHCRQPTDRQWTWLDLTNRANYERVAIKSFLSDFAIESDNPNLAARTAMLLIERSGATVGREDLQQLAGVWSHTEALARTRRIQAEFSREELKPFDSHLFWGSWKWVGWFATDLTWVGRWIMNSVLTHDARAVKLCVEWLRNGTVHKDQSAALRYALTTLTGLSFDTNANWVSWYDGQGKQKYPEPNLQTWLKELKRNQ